MDFLAQPLAPVLAGFYAVFASYGLAIILLTLAVRVILLPLSIKSTRSMREMQVIQPELKRLQKKHKGDRQKLNEETMALYKEHGVNPLGGCLPLLLQMPVFFALFYLIRDPLAYLAENVSLATDLQERALSVHNFLGLRLDCSPLQVFGGEASDVESVTELCASAGGGNVLQAAPYFLMLVVMGVSTYYQQRQMMAARGGATDPQQQQMQTITKILPLVLLVFGVSFPAGVILYWLTTNFWTIVQQRIMLRAAPLTAAQNAAAEKGKDKTKDKAALGKGGAKSASSKGSGAKGGSKSTGKGGSKSTAKTDGTGAKKAQLKGGPAQPGRKTPDKKAPAGSSSPSNKGGNRKKKR